MKAYKFRIYPDMGQRVLMEKTFGCVRAIYNLMLRDKIDYYETHGKPLNVTPALYKKDYEWLREVDSLALANAQINLDKAFTNFFKGKGRIGFPNFKSKHKGKFTYTTNNINGSIRVTGNCIRLPKLGEVKIRLHREIPEGSPIKNVTVTRTPSGKYYASICADINIKVPKVTPETVTGIDFSMNRLAVLSNGDGVEYPKFYRRTAEKLARAQRTLSRRKRGSNRYRKQKIKIATLHEKIANQRKDFLHKLSNLITKDYDLVCLESLDMQAMSKCLNFGKSVHDAGFGMLRTFLLYKSEERGKHVVCIDKWFPSSKTCSACGNVLVDLTLKDRVYKCACGYENDRDINAAINIRNEGVRSFVAAGHVVSAQLCCILEDTRLRSPHLKASA